MLTRIVVSTAVVVSALLCGTALALAPLWPSAETDLDPAGDTCWIEQDPGSGPSSVGVERNHRGLVPFTECVPVADNPNVPDGEAFNEAARRALAGETMPVAQATLDNAKYAEVHPVWRRAWPYFAAAASVMLAVFFGLVVHAVVTRRSARRRPQSVRPPAR